MPFRLGFVVSQMPLTRVVTFLLQQEPGTALCDACLAYACAVSLSEIRPVIEGLLQSNPMFQHGSSCVSCRRAVPSTLYARPKKCAHCSRPLAEGAASLTFDIDVFHDACLRRLLADETMRASHKLNRRSRELIEQSLRRLRDGRSGDAPTQ